MKGPVLSACLASALVLMASGARAEPADCDLFCHLQGYLSTDHMAASPEGAATPAAATPAKLRHHAASAPAKPAKPGSEIASKSVLGTDAAGKPPVQAITKGPTKAAAGTEPHAVLKKDAAVAAFSTKPGPAKGLKAAAAAPKPVAAVDPSIEPPKHRAVAAVVLPPTPVVPAPAVAAAPKRFRRIARVVAHLGRKDAPRPVESAAALIPGSARLVPAEFQAFGDL